MFLVRLSSNSICDFVVVYDFVLIFHSHSKLTKGGYLCSRCSTKVCALPIECPACGLTLILSTHLARSYHHLFPLRNWVEVPWSEYGLILKPQEKPAFTDHSSRASKSTNCYACQTSFPPSPSDSDELKAPAKTANGTSISSRYACTSCHKHFCIDCDVFCHETLYNCPSCQSSAPAGERPKDPIPKRANIVNGASLLGALASDLMDID